MAELFPIFLKLNGRKALVVGGGKMAAMRTKQLLNAGAKVRVVSPEAGSEIERLAKAKLVVLVRRGFKRTDLSRRYFIIIAATNDANTQRAVFEEAERRGILCNVVDKPESCNFYMPAIVHRGELKIAISTSGRSPALAGKLRQYLEEAVPENAADLTEVVGRLRSKLRLEIPGDLTTQKKLVDEFVERVLKKRRVRQSPQARAL
ncbi:MAG TPA: bifunctional precorrin-2 dehydrogenase/sirohydrochlorin ferrochelatase [Terriglobia bacterium]|nr:bifunctional precorrin-2 dehydrogenase/sirohydrochlorin ferrochelatase [Terriglobia bacterium]